MANKIYLKSLKILNILFFLGMVTVNALANLLPIGGKNTGELSDALPNLFVPAGITFSIWGVIYLALLAFVIYQARDLLKKQENTPDYTSRVNIFFIISCIANMGWIFAWHYEQILLSLIIMIILLASLIMIYLRLRANINMKEIKLPDKILVYIPFSIYLGWITVATIANITAVLVKYNWDGFGIAASIWTIIVIIVSCFIGVVMILKTQDIFYVLVLIWAYIGIIIKRSSSTPVYTEIIIVSSITIFIIVFFIILKFIFQLRTGMGGNNVD